MRRYVAPVVLFVAVGAVVFVLLRAREGERAPRESDTPPVTAVEPPAPRKEGTLRPRNTPTKLEEHRWLSELERVLERDDLSRAGYYRSKVCEDIERIQESEYLSRNLLTTIRKYGIEGDDMKRRDIVLPILRVFATPEATALIQSAYYGARDKDERMTMIEAMSHSYHNPATAAVWATEAALNSDSSEDRYRAWQCIRDFSGDDALAFRTAKEIYEGSARSDQKQMMLMELTGYGNRVPEAAEYTRALLRNPKHEEVGMVAAAFDVWGDMEDADRLEALIPEFPDLEEFLRERITQIRKNARERNPEKYGPPPIPDEPELPGIPPPGEQPPPPPGD